MGQKGDIALLFPLLFGFPQRHDCLTDFTRCYSTVIQRQRRAERSGNWYAKSL